jgi:Zn-dependent membrane protease YugP
MIFFDSVYFWYVMIPTLLLSLGVQLYLSRTFAKWSAVENTADLTGEQVADALFARTSLNEIPVSPTKGSLTDHYDPRSNTVALSQPVYYKDTVAAMAVTAHELGHVQQYQEGSALIAARGFLMPAIQFSPMISYFAFMMGILFNLSGLMWVGIFFFGLMVLFSLLTLPVEIDASRRALKMLDEAGLYGSEEDRKGARSVLTAAAMTYLAAAITSVLQLLYYISLAQRRR